MSLSEKNHDNRENHDNHDKAEFRQNIQNSFSQPRNLSGELIDARLVFLRLVLVLRVRVLFPVRFQLQFLLQVQVLLINRSRETCGP